MKEEKSKIHTPGGSITLKQAKKDRAPRLFIQDNEQKVRNDFSFEPILNHFSAPYLSGLRFSPHGKYGAALLEAQAEQLLVLFNPMTSTWRKLFEGKIIDFALPSDQTVAILNKKEDLLALHIIGKHPNVVPLPLPCIHANLEVLQEDELLMRCSTGDSFRWWKYSTLENAFDEIQGVGEIISVASSDKASYMISLAANSSYSIFRTNDRGIAGNHKQIYEFAPDVFPEKLYRVPGGFLVRARQGFFVHYLFFPSNGPQKETPITIRKQYCSLFHEPYIGAVSSLFFRCETPVAINHAVRFDIQSRRISTQLQTLPALDSTAVPNHEFAIANDGLNIPITIFNTSTPREESTRTAPLLVLTYGSYGKVFPSRFQPLLSLLSQQGFIIAIPHIRGGGFNGSTWHKAARAHKKERTVSDLRAAIEYLRHRYPKRIMIGIGKSAGAWPLFASQTFCSSKLEGLILEMPLVDPLRQITSEDPYWAQEEKEWGNPNHRQIKELYTKFDIKHLKDPLPAIYLRIGQDDALLPAEPLLQWTSDLIERFPGLPLTLDIGENTGHLGAFNLYEEITAQAHQAAFLHELHQQKFFNGKQTKCLG